MNDELLHFIETAFFRKRLDKLASIETLFALQNELLKNPTLGKIIQGTNGARKARIAEPKSNRGKSISFRYIYVYLEAVGTIYLLVIYGKNEKDNLTDAEKKEIFALVKMLKNTEGK